MQNLVLPFSLAIRAASRTGSMSSNFEAVLGAPSSFDIHQGAELDLAWVVVLAVYRSCSEDEI